jgi:hypothetical protein
VLFGIKYNVMNDTWLLALEIVLPLLAAISGLWLYIMKAYGAERAKNAAAYADIDKLVANTEALTKAAKIIEARISIDIWSQQQRWDVQKTALLESLKELASTEALLWAMVHCFSATKNHALDERAAYRKEANEKYNNAINAFWRTKLAVQIVCGNELAEQFEKIDRLFAITRNRATQGEFGDVWNTQFNEIMTAKKELGNLIRKQLDFESTSLTLNPVDPRQLKALTDEPLQKPN